MTIETLKDYRCDFMAQMPEQLRVATRMVHRTNQLAVIETLQFGVQQRNTGAARALVNSQYAAERSTETKNNIFLQPLNFRLNSDCEEVEVWSFESTIPFFHWIRNAAKARRRLISQ